MTRYYPEETTLDRIPDIDERLIYYITGHEEGYTEGSTGWSLRHAPNFSKKVANFEPVVKRFGFSNVMSVLDAIDTWLTGKLKNMRRAGELLIENRDIVQVLLPMPRPPRFLWRALRNAHIGDLDLGTKVVYSDRRAPFSSWSQSPDAAYVFCKKGEGIVFAISGRLAIDRAFLWPVTKISPIRHWIFLDLLLQEQEWALYIQGQVNVEEIHDCSGSKRLYAKRKREETGTVLRFNKR